MPETPLLTHEKIITNSLVSITHIGYQGKTNNYKKHDPSYCMPVSPVEIIVIDKWWENLQSWYRGKS